MVVSHHPKERQPPSLRSCEGLQWERSSSCPIVPTKPVHTASVGDFYSCAEKTCFQEAL